MRGFSPAFLFPSYFHLAGRGEHEARRNRRKRIDSLRGERTARKMVIVARRKSLDYAA